MISSFAWHWLFSNFIQLFLQIRMDFQCYPNTLRLWSITIYSTLDSLGYVIELNAWPTRGIVCSNKPAISLFPETIWSSLAGSISQSSSTILQNLSEPIIYASFSWVPFKVFTFESCQFLMLCQKFLNIFI